MTLAQIFVVLVVLIPIILVITNRLRIDVAALLSALALGIAQFLGLGVLGNPNTPDEAAKAISGFSQPVVITLLALFIVTRCLDRTGVTRWIARKILAVGGHSERRLIFLFTAATAVLSLFMNNLAAGALLLPSAMDVARRTGIRPSKLLIPVAYGSLLGGSATYFTTANIIASDLLTTAQPPQAPLHILDFTPTGGLLALAGIAFVTWFGPRLLPNRTPKPEQSMARRTGSELEDVYQLDERLWEVRVPAGAKAVGKTLAQLQFGQRLGVAIAAIWHGRQAIFTPAPDQVIASGDILLTVGREERVSQLTGEGFKVGRDNTNGHVSARGVRFVEVALTPHSNAEGSTLRELEFRKRYGFTAVALLRDDRSYRTDVADMKLQTGDALLAVGAPHRLKSLQADANFIVLEPDFSDQPVERQSGDPIGGDCTCRHCCVHSRSTGFPGDAGGGLTRLYPGTAASGRCLSYNGMAGDLLDCGHVFSEHRHGEHRFSSADRAAGDHVGCAIWSARIGGRGVLVDGCPDAVNGRTSHNVGDRPHCHQRGYSSRREPAGRGCRGSHWLLCIVFHTDCASGQHPHDGARQLHVLGLFSPGLGIDHRLLCDAPHRYGAVLAFVN